MPTVADVLRRYGGQYLERFGATMPGEHKKVLHAITACRTGELGTVLYACQFCGEIHAIGRSCGNRHCPTCQRGKTKAWLEKQTDRLLPSRANFLVPRKALSILFRGKFRDILARENLLHLVDPAVWRRDWVVNSQAVGDGSASLRYLAPYVFRVAIGDHRIVSCEDGKVTFTYRRVGSK